MNERRGTYSGLNGSRKNYPLSMSTLFYQQHEDNPVKLVLRNATALEKKLEDKSHG